jgi:hypothetical protein
MTAPADTTGVDDLSWTADPPANPRCQSVAHHIGDPVQFRRFAVLATSALTLAVGVAVAAPAQADDSFTLCSNAVTWQGWKFQSCLTDYPNDWNQIHGYTTFSDVGARTDVIFKVNLWENCGSGWNMVDYQPTGRVYPGTAGTVRTTKPFGFTNFACDWEAHGWVTDNDKTMADAWSPTIWF